MTRALGLSLIVASALTAMPRAVGPAPPEAVQDPQVQNGRTEHRPVTSIARDLVAVGGGAEPVWVGWLVPMVAGERDLCNWYSNPSVTVRGFFADAGQTGTTRPQIAPPTGPVPLEAGTRLLVLARMLDGRLDRLRTLTDDCPIDAGGRTIYWLDGVTPASSLAWLESLTALDAATVADRLTLDARRSTATSAVSAIALHADAGADAMLDRLAGSGTDASLRRQAASRMAAYRGATGFAALQRLLASETDLAMRRSVVSALGQTRQPGTPDLMLGLARDDRDPRARGEAAAAYLRLAGSTGIPPAMALVTPETPDAVSSRVVSGLANLPDDQGVPSLMTIARSGLSLPVRRSALAALGRSDQPAAGEALLALARTDPEPRLRSEAAYEYIRAVGESGVANLAGIIERDADVVVRRRAIAGLASLPGDAGVPHLITLARSSQIAVVKREAVSAIGRSKDPRARAYLEEIIRR
jgi:HEAT repeat protein